MSNNEDINIDDILPPKKDSVEKFVTAETRVPEFLKEAAYSPDETREETIKKDWERLTNGLSDYVLAEQLTEYELRGMGKPVAENYSMYFNTTLKEVRKNRKKAEQRLFKFIPAHSQLDCEAFFNIVHEQNEKEKEARLKSMEKGLKKEAAAYCQTCGKEAKPGDATHDKHTVIDLPADPDPKVEEAKRREKMGLKKEASAQPFCYSCNKALAPEETKLHESKAHSVGVTKEAAGRCQKCGAELVDASNDPLCGNCRGEVNKAQDSGADDAMKKEATGPHTKMDPKEEEELKKSLEKVLPKKEEAPKEPEPKKEADAAWTSPEAQQGSQTNPEAVPCTHCKNEIPAKKGLVLLDKPFCMQCHDAGHSTPMNAAAPAKPTEMPPMSTSTGPMTSPLLKEASKWSDGTELEAKHNGARACVVHVNDKDKTYVIKVDGTMYPSYYSFEDAHDTFNKGPMGGSATVARERMEGLTD
jgi:hypothetical protein